MNNSTEILRRRRAFGMLSSEQERELQAIDRKAHFEALDKLSTEERLRRVEEWQYDFRNRHVPAPRY